MNETPGGAVMNRLRELIEAQDWEGLVMLLDRYPGKFAVYYFINTLANCPLNYFPDIRKGINDYIV